MTCSCFFRLVSLAGILLLGSGCSDAQISQELRALAGGAPARVVWARQTHGTDDFVVTKDRFRLMGLDTEDRIGARVILPEIGNYHKPLLTAAGDRVVFSDVNSSKIYVVNWDGTGLQELASGMADDVWLDPETGIEWVYSIPMTTDVREPVQPLTRIQLDNPGVREIVLSGVPLNADNLQLSNNGELMSIQFPWPDVGVLDVPSGTITRVGRGCWPAMAPDNSRLMWVFDGPHRNLIFHELDSERRWVVNINGAPGVDEYEVFHPRWSNQIRFMSMSGPYRKGLFHGTEEVNIYVGRFNEMLTEVEAWVQVSDSEGADFYPDFWVQPDAGRYHSLDQGHLGEVEVVNEEKLEVFVRLVEMTQTPVLADIAPYTSTMVVYLYDVIEVVAGQYDRSQLLAAHWGIINRKRTDLQMKVGDVVKLELEPYSNRGELEGERLVMELSDMHHPLFYDLGGN